MYSYAGVNRPRTVFYRRGHLDRNLDGAPKRALLLKNLHGHVSNVSILFAGNIPPSAGNASRAQVSGK